MSSATATGAQRVINKAPTRLRRRVRLLRPLLMLGGLYLCFEGAEKLAHKRSYLNFTSFVLRALAYFLVWIYYAYRLRALSIEQDATGDPRLTQRMRSLSPFALLIFVRKSDSRIGRSVL